MKLLILTTIYPRGKQELPGNKMHGKFIRDFAIGWMKIGYEVHVLTPHSINTLSYEKLDGIHVHRFHYFIREPWETLTYGDGIPKNIQKFKNKLLVPFLSFSFFVQALRLIRRNGIPIVNAHWALPAGYIGCWIKKFTGIFLITTLYGAELFPVLSGRMAFLRPFLSRAVNGADFVAGISEETAKTAMAISKRRDVRTIPDGIDLAYYQPGPASASIQEKYGIRNRKALFFSGRMVERKGHRYLLEAMKHIGERLQDVKLVLGGRGPLFEELAALRETWGLEGKVEMPGFIPEEDMVPLLQTSQLFVLPSCVDRHGDTEGSATAALEAMACGTPAIISRIGGNIGAIRHGIGAFYVEPADSLQLAEKIVSLLSIPDALARQSKAAREFVASTYAWSHVVEAYRTLSGLESIESQT